MAKTKLDEKILQAAVLGGSFYGCGGGGDPDTGLAVGREALRIGQPCLVHINDLPEEAVLVTVSAVGSPAGTGYHARAQDYVRAVEVFCEKTGIQPSGYISNECGGLASVNGWVQSAATGIPLVDAPCNGRAHPTGIMGSMGLQRIPDYRSIQVAVGGSAESGTYHELLVTGSLQFAGDVVRSAAARAGGLVAVARNPVSANYAKDHSAPGAFSLCVEVGMAMLSASTGKDRILAALKAASGTIIAWGTVAKKLLETEGGFDVGEVTFDTDKGPFVATFWNEYMTLESGDGRRLATFPDLIATLDSETGNPITTAALRQGQEVALVTVPSPHLILGAGMRDPALFLPLEQAVGKEILAYAFGAPREPADCRDMPEKEQVH